MSHDPDLPRSMTIIVVDAGDAWDVQVKRNRINPIDDDVCDLLAQVAYALELLHRDSHIAKDLHEHRN